MQRKGSISLETAISFSIVLVLMACMITVISLHRTNIIMQSSVEASCEKIAVLAPLSVPAADSIYTVVNALPDSDFLNTQAASVLSYVGSSIWGINASTDNSLAELLLDGTLGQVLRDDIASEYYSRTGSLLLEPESITVNLYLNDSHHILEVEVNYTTSSILGNKSRCIYSAIPLYGDFDLLLNPEQTEDENNEENIWNEHNFTRGQYFRERYGANLPQTFPVVDRYENGSVESIVSIDLTAPTYSENSSATYQRLCEEVDDLASFSGADVVISGERYTISDNDIVDRTLRVIVPANSSSETLDEVHSAIIYGISNGVDVVVVEEGESSRYY